MDVEDDENFVIASVINIGLLLGFDKATPETQVNICREQLSLENFQVAKNCCKVNGQNHENKTTIEIDREYLIQYAAEQL